MSRGLASFLEQLDKLEQRPLPHPGNSARGRAAPFFRALENLEESALQADGGALLERLAQALIERLGDLPLLPSILEAARPALAERLLALLRERQELNERWGYERLLAVLDEDGCALFDVLGELLEGPSAALTPERARTMLDVRSRTPERWRDSSSTLLSERAAAALAQDTDDGRSRHWIVKVIAWESLRSEKDTPRVALVAIETLAAFPLFERLRHSRRLLDKVKRRVSRNRLEAVYQAARDEVLLPEEQLQDISAVAFAEPGITVSCTDEGALAIEASDDILEDRATRAQIERNVESTRELWATRLESALISRERWRYEVWCDVFRDSGCPVRAALCQRLVWAALDDDDVIALRSTEDGFVDVFGEPFERTPQSLALAHPMDIEREELDLWRQLLIDEGWVQPFAQLFRPFFPRDILERFEGCMVPGDAPPRGRARSIAGLPLRGRAPWELTRRLGEDEALVTVDGSDQRLVAIEWELDPHPRSRSELALDLFDLVGASYYGNHLSWQQWNRELLGDGEASWNKALKRYQRAPNRIPAIRRRWLEAIKHRLPNSERLSFNGRFAVIAGGAIVELGSGNVHELRSRRYRPPRESLYRPVPLPHNRAADPQLDRVLGAVAALMADQPEDEDA